ncbi:hypothetical protein OGAPHI_002315 [Ogataea philodendri]|uniref:Uncharacterized protein n=1 Tax=Ogataea philodendri TaxID=1378263 RepID=A0A9P8PB81_9ASCO|nr:uncharacterized protein OGAPHI_002315 [Ogataea philodendri]KAH3668561.1 hypothetical protein OGAPHI_002315 [Ogataea philodendri]
MTHRRTSSSGSTRPEIDPKQRSNSTFSYALGNDSTSSFLQQNTVSNVEFNNVRNSQDLPQDTASHSSLQRSVSSSTTASRIGTMENKISRFFNKTAEKMRRSPSETHLSALTPNPSTSTAASSPSVDKGSGIGNGFSAKLKRPDNLSIQTTILPTKELKSPLARTSKEVERIASLSTLTEQPPKHKHYHGILRSRKDPTKSSSSSNSKASAFHGGETMYSFHPSLVNSSMTVQELQNTITELEKLSVNNSALSGDTDAIADEAWSLVSSLVLPLFYCERLKTPIEEMNKLVFLHLRLRSNQPQHDQMTYSPVASPNNFSSVFDGAAATTPYTPLGAPTPTFTSTGRSPSSYNTMSPVHGPSVLQEVQEFLKHGMNTYLTQLYQDEASKEFALKPRERKVSPTKRSALLIVTSEQSFRDACALLWDYFFQDMYYYLQGVFLPLEDESFESLLSGPGGWRRNSNVQHILLTSFRDNVVIPLYENVRQAEADKERRRERTMSLATNSSVSLQRLSHENLKADNPSEGYRNNKKLLHCLSILVRADTNDTNQKIVENLVQQVRERCAQQSMSSKTLVV